MIITPASLRLAASILKHRFGRPIPRVTGSAECILRTTLDRLWNGRFFAAGLGHYHQFWMRDFGLALPGLLAAGQRDRALASLEFALQAYEKKGRVTTTVFADGLAADLPGRALDSLGWLIYSLHTLEAGKLVDKYRHFLILLFARIREQFLDEQWFPKQGIQIFGLRDHVYYSASCYDAAMAWRLADDARTLGLAELPQFSAEQFRERYWTGSYYREDLVEPARWSAEANLMPFLFGLDIDPERFKSATSYIWERGLDQPVALAYSHDRHPLETWAAHLFLPNSQGTCRWPILGVLLAELLEKFKDPRSSKVRQNLKQLVENFGLFLELLTPTGDLYRSPWYKSDVGMLWGSRLLIKVKS